MMCNGFNTVFSGKPDFEQAEHSLQRFKEEYPAEDSHIRKEYAYLSSFFQSLFISDDGYVIDVGNFQTANNEILEDILKRVKKHPILWKFFMVC